MVSCGRVDVMTNVSITTSRTGRNRSSKSDSQGPADARTGPTLRPAIAAASRLPVPAASIPGSPNVQGRVLNELWATKRRERGLTSKTAQ